MSIVRKNQTIVYESAALQEYQLTDWAGWGSYSEGGTVRRVVRDVRPYTTDEDFVDYEDHLVGHIRYARRGRPVVIIPVESEDDGETWEIVVRGHRYSR